MNNENVIAKITVKELREFIYENYYKKIGFTGKETIIYLKRLEKH